MASMIISAHGTDARSGAQPDYGQVESPDRIEPEQTPTPPQRFHFPWKFVSSQLTNSKGDEIFYPVNDERDRQWARRLEWVIGHHLDRLGERKTTWKSCMPII